MPAPLDRFRLLGDSGLRVSPLSLGTMTFGTEWGWGTPKDECRRIFDAYVEAGGNFVDTANFYTGGTSETYLGEFVSGRRDSLVIASKYALVMRPGDPNSGGSHRKNLAQSLDASLKRLKVDHIDLYWVHAWDFTVPIDEVMRALDDAVRAGKILHAGVSNAPAWVIARANTIAQWRGRSPFVAAQMQYSLAERAVEREIAPACAELGVSLVAWSPLAGGVLTGKYARADAGSRDALDESLRKESNQKRANARNLAIIAAAEEIAKACGCSTARVAIAWVMQKPNVASVIIGARTPAQLQDNLAAATLELGAEQVQRLDDASRIDLGYPHDYLSGKTVQRFLYGDAKID